MHFSLSQQRTVANDKACYLLLYGDIKFRYWYSRLRWSLKYKHLFMYYLRGMFWNKIKTSTWWVCNAPSSHLSRLESRNLRKISKWATLSKGRVYTLYTVHSIGLPKEIVKIIWYNDDRRHYARDEQEYLPERLAVSPMSSSSGRGPRSATSSARSRPMTASRAWTVRCRLSLNSSSSPCISAT